MIIFAATSKVEVISDLAVLTKEYPLLVAVDRAIRSETLFYFVDYLRSTATVPVDLILVYRFQEFERSDRDKPGILRRDETRGYLNFDGKLTGLKDKFAG